MTTSKCRAAFSTLAVGVVLAGCWSCPSGTARDPADPYLLIDRRPYGAHSAFAFGVPGDPYEPARSAGIAWTRDGEHPYVFWALVDPDRTGDPEKMRFAGIAPQGPDGLPFRFDYDRGIGDATESGLAVMWNIAVEPTTWGYSKPGSWLPADEHAYASFVKTTIRRYPAVRVWQVGNEPDIQLGMPPEPKLADFAKLQRLTYEAIKDADPGVVVAMGGSADWNNGYFDTVLDDLEGCWVDVFDFHLYGDPLGGTLMAKGTSPALGYRQIEEQALDIRRHLDARGFTRTRIWTTENGTFSGTIPLGPAVVSASEADQARDLPKRTIVALASGVEKLFWAYGISEGLGAWQDEDFFDHTGLIYTGHGAPAGTKKLGYWALWQMTRQLEGCDFQEVERLATGVPETRAYRCTLMDGGQVLVAWWDTFAVPGYEDGDRVSLVLPWDAPTAVARPAVPPVASGAEVTDPETAFPATRLAPGDGAVAIEIGPDPVWVRAE